MQRLRSIATTAAGATSLWHTSLWPPVMARSPDRAMPPTEGLLFRNLLPRYGTVSGPCHAADRRSPLPQPPHPRYGTVWRPLLSMSLQAI